LVPIAASIPAQHANRPSFCAPWRFITALTARRDVGTIKLLSQMKQEDARPPGVRSLVETGGA
jgi:hypothetical protein